MTAAPTWLTGIVSFRRNLLLLDAIFPVTQNRKIISFHHFYLRSFYFKRGVYNLSDQHYVAFMHISNAYHSCVTSLNPLPWYLLWFFFIRHMQLYTHIEYMAELYWKIQSTTLESLGVRKSQTVLCRWEKVSESTMGT